MRKFLFLLMLPVLLSACVNRPPDVVPVAQFDSARYLGKWYEIARIDHWFERGLSEVTADYSPREDGGLRVINRGFHAADGKWSESTGKAFFVDSPEVGFLKVSFFGPFYGAYVIFELDTEHYQYSLVGGADKSYLWLLSRTPTLEPAVQARLLAHAAALGFDTSQLVFVKQSAPASAAPAHPPVN